jgi:2-dehydro-3-deoxyphosphogluconate aldolase/(4S)-4-hydroxy-2-oxoglutarate aldolase
MLKQFNNLFSQDIFCPTCGINKFNYKEFLSLSNVICVGGSWEDKTNKKI